MKRITKCRVTRPHSPTQARNKVRALCVVPCTTQRVGGGRCPTHESLSSLGQPKELPRLRLCDVRLLFFREVCGECDWECE